MKLILAVMLACLSICASAQSGWYRQGKVMLDNGVTLNGYILYKKSKMSNGFLKPAHVLFKSDREVKHTKLKNGITGFVIARDSFTNVRNLAVKLPFPTNNWKTDDMYFVEVLKTGDISLYQHDIDYNFSGVLHNDPDLESNYGSLFFGSTYIACKEGDCFTFRNKEQTRTALNKLLADAPEILQKFHSQTPDQWNIRELVRAYNWR